MAHPLTANDRFDHVGYRCLDHARDGLNGASVDLRVRIDCRNAVLHGSNIDDLRLWRRSGVEILAGAAASATTAAPTDPSGGSSTGHPGLEFRERGRVGRLEEVRVLLRCSMGGSGHLMPLLEVGDAFRGQGHECALLVPPSLSDAADGAGIRVVTGGQPAAAAVDQIWSRVRQGPPEEVVGVVDRELFAELATDAMLGAAERLSAEFTPDLIVRESCEYATSMVAHRRGLPQAQVGVSAAMIEARVLKDVAMSLDRRCRGVSDAIRRAPYLTAFPEPLDPSPWRQTVRYRQSPHSPQPLPNWWPGSEGQPLIYVTFGSVLSGMEEALGVYRTAMDAVADMPVRVLITVGRGFNQERLGPSAINTHIERWVPQADVFAAADLVVCHGGSGTTNGALAAGLPLVVCPLFADQNRNAETIQRAGAGTVLRSRKAPAGGVASLDHTDVPALSDAIISALNTSKYRETAQRIASAIAATPTLSDTVQTLGAGNGK